VEAAGPDRGEGVTAVLAIEHGHGGGGGSGGRERENEAAAGVVGSRRSSANVATMTELRRDPAAPRRGQGQG
jgi:hypothetical protein